MGAKWQRKKYFLIFCNTLPCVFVILSERGEHMEETLYEQHYRELLRYAARMCGNEELAQDLVQDTFLKALQNSPLLGELGISQRRAWLYKVMKRLYFDHYRRRQLEHTYLEDQQSEAAYWEPGIQQVENRMLLSNLSQEDRALFHLRYEEGYSAAELAEMFHVPPGTVRARLCRSRALLRKIIQE